MAPQSHPPQMRAIDPHRGQRVGEAACPGPTSSPRDASSDNLKTAYDEDERRSSVPSTRAVREEKQRAGKASEVRSEKGDEPAKRKYKSKHGSKKAAKKASKFRRSQDPEEDDWELDIGDDVPQDKLRETLTAMHRVTTGLRASSEKAESAVSQMTRVMGRLNRARNAERGWLQEENRLLKDIVGWKKRKPKDPTPPPSDSEEEETDSLEEDELESAEDPDM